MYKPYSFNIPEDIDDFNKSNQNNDSASKINSIVKGNSKISLSKVLQKLSRDNKQDNYEKKIIKQQIKKQDVDDNDEDIFNNPNFHSEDQDEFEIPDGNFI
ncbi:hypothetical protein RhiirA4_474492 [Rhizophagus irregularis]|uniref:Uncharacterized protein n=1 Tax=Rhizophagus irregularis TaxID=588596 RepID=A0A2I1H8K6_9GLOM|nr:hypothetical protein RhiirA4_474492 [Rhizophagus irregularis]